jgi:hypothetical protein
VDFDAMKTTVDYFYNNSLRLDFGFENPNKAAVMFACLLPLLLVGWALAWNWRKPWWGRYSAAILAGALILTCALCLFRTYSRGGVLAAVVGLLYLLVCTPRLSSWSEWVHSARFKATVVLFVVVGVLFAWVGLGERSIEPITTGDASVGHRLILWQSAVQMAADNPTGFGTGKSGEAYMQWYQAIDATSAYRTMVSSYLTFLVEQGWFWFTIVAIVAGLFWVWALPATQPGLAAFEVAIGLRASILAFIVSGVFSTVMEEPVLWIIPGTCVAILVCWSILNRVPVPISGLAGAIAAVAVFCAGLYLGGIIESRQDPLSRQFTSGQDGRIVSVLTLKAGPTSPVVWTVTPDVRVLGPDYGKLLRQLVLETGVTLRISRAEDLHLPIERLLLVGDGVKQAPVSASSAIVLLAPSAVPANAASAWIAASPRAVVLNPAIDEDRRALSWRTYAFTARPANLTMRTLSAVGLRVDWAWEDVIATVKTL